MTSSPTASSPSASSNAAGARPRPSSPTLLSGSRAMPRSLLRSSTSGPHLRRDPRHAARQEGLRLAVALGAPDLVEAVGDLEGSQPALADEAAEHLGEVERLALRPRAEDHRLQQEQAVVDVAERPGRRALTVLDDQAALHPHV